MKTAFLTAIYEEPKADKTFKGLKLFIKSDGKKEKIHHFNTGDPIIDFYNFKKWIAHNSDKEKLMAITCSSSVDHFYMDSKKYNEKVVIFDKDYKDGRIVNWMDAKKEGKNIDELVKVCVTEKIKTWKELKDYINKKETPKTTKVSKSKVK